MNDENLKNGVPFQFQAGEEQAKIAALGGVASGAARRRNRTLRQIAEMLASNHIQVKQPDGSKVDTTYDVAMIMRQYQKAIKEGDVAAAKYLTNLLGEEVMQQQAVNIYNVSQPTADAMKKLEESDI